MATRIKMSELEQRIIDRVFHAQDGYEPIEDLLAEIGAERGQFVDALENLEGSGYLSVSNLGGNVVVASQDPVAIAQAEAPHRGLIYSNRVGQC